MTPQGKVLVLVSSGHACPKHAGLYAALATTSMNLRFRFVL